ALRFLGRTGNVSDRFGEKLAEGFVADVIQKIIAHWPAGPRFALLAPEEIQTGARYTLYLEGTQADPAGVAQESAPPEMAKHLDTLLRQNPHYALCRDLGQLQFPGVFLIRTRGYETFVARECAQGGRLGEIKPCSLSSQTGWSHYFDGDYLGEI